MTDTNLNTQRLFANRYQLERLLGSGGMGKVYLATDTKLNHDQVALKILHVDLCRDEKHVKRFMREVQLTRKVTHPNVVRTFDIGDENGRMFFTMELVEGTSVRERIDAGSLTPWEAARIVAEVSKGLQAIHDEGIIHRDMKPANVVITENNEVRITDFGVARPGRSDITGHDEIVGSAPYMAPEVWVGRNVGQSSDIYSMGVMFYELLTGSMPFEADSPAQMMHHHLETPPPNPALVQPEVPDWMCALVMRMLAKDQNLRPISAKEVADAIEERLKLYEAGQSDEHLNLAPEPLILGGGYQASPETRIPEGAPLGFAEPPAISPDDSLENPTQVDANPTGVNSEAHPFRVNLGVVRQRQHLNSSQYKVDPLEAKAHEAKMAQRRLWGRYLGALVLTVALAVLLLGPIGVGLEILLGRMMRQVSIFERCVAIAVAAIYYAAILALPIILLSCREQPIRESFWTWFALGQRILGLFVALLVYNIGRIEHMRFTLELQGNQSRVMPVFKDTLKNLGEIAFLMPGGTYYETALQYRFPVLSPDTTFNFYSALPFHLGWIVYMALFFHLLNRTALPRPHLGEEKFSWGLRLFCAVGVTPMLLELGLRQLLLNPEAPPAAFPVKLLGFTHQLDPYFIVCGLVNWLLVVGAVLIAVPYYESKRKAAEDKFIQNSGQILK